MLLSFLERVLLLQLLPPENSVVDLRIIIDLKRKLAASENEIKEHNIKQENGNITWDKNFETEIEIGDRAKEIIKNQLLELDKNKKLTENHLSLYEKFAENKTLMN